MLETLATLALLYLFVGASLDRLVTWSQRRKDAGVSRLQTVILWVLWPQVVVAMVRIGRTRRRSAKS